MLAMIGNAFTRLSFARRVKAGTLPAFALMLAAWPTAPAEAACVPPAGAGTPAPGTTVTCSGATTGQNAPHGYGDGSQTGIIINVLSGASVAGAPASGGHGLNLAGANTINNSGTLTGAGVAAGIGGNGVNITGNSSVITTSGTVVGGSNATSGIGGGGIFISGNASNVANSGTLIGGNVAVSGIGGSGLEILGNNSTINNSGATTGGNAGTGASIGGDGITVLGTNNTIVNSGSSTGGNSGDGASVGGNGIIALNGHNTIINSGTARGGNAGIVGASSVIGGDGILAAGGNNSVVNTGTVVGGNGVGAGSQAGNGALLSGGNNALTNGGVIAVGAGDRTVAAAVSFTGNSNTLTNLVGSRIVGAINFNGSTGNQVNFVGGGNYAYTFDSLAGATVNAGGAPFVVSGSTVVVVDPTPFAAADRNLMDFTRGISSILGSLGGTTAGPNGPLSSAFAPSDTVSARVDDAFAEIGVPPALAYAGDAMVFKSPTVVDSFGRAVWARGFGGQHTQDADGVLLRSTTTFYGGAVGFDMVARPDLRLGLFAGGGQSRFATALNVSRIDTDTAFGGIYGRWAFASLGAPSFFDFALHGGSSHNASTRVVANNLAANGLEVATAGFNSWYISPEVAYGIHMPLWGQYTLTPSLRVRYVAGFYDGFTESGSTANLTVGSRTISDFEERGELKLTRATPLGSDLLLTSLYVGAIGVERAGDTSINTVVLGATLPFVTPGRSAVGGVLGGGGLEWRTREGWSFFGAAEAIGFNDSSTVVSARGGVRVAW
jgi:uncharacterized protein with beta-barrel porin domain